MRAVVFDLFGTLVPNLPPERWRETYREIATILKVDAEAFEQAWTGSFERRMVGGVREIEEQLLHALNELGAMAEARCLARAAESKTRFMLEATQPKPEALEMLNALRARGLKLALATDCSWETPEILDQGPLGAFFAVRAASARLGVRKPHERMYRHVLQGLGVSGAECWYVGDGNSNELVGARRHSMRTVWVDNGDAQFYKDGWTPGGDHTVRDLREILRLIDGG